MEKNFYLKQFFLRYLIFFSLLFPLIVAGCGGGDSDWKSEDDSGGGVATSELSGIVLTGDDQEAIVSIYDSGGNAVEYEDSGDGKAVQAVKTTISTSSGSFKFIFEKDKYSYPFLVVAKKGDLVFLSLADKGRTSLNVSSFSTSVIMELIGDVDKIREIASGPGSYIKSSSPAWLNFNTFEAKAKESFSDDEVRALFFGSKSEYNALSEKISSIVKKVALFSDKNLKTADISGVVKSLKSDSPLSGVRVSSALAFSSAITDGNGLFVLEDIPASEDIPLNFNKKGYTSNLEIFSIDSNSSDEERSSAVETFLKPVTTSETKTVAELRNALEESSASSLPVKIAAKDNSIAVKFSLSGRKLLESRGLLADDSQVITFEMTSVDPTSEREVFPGDFSAENSSRNNLEYAEQETTLESVVLADMSMYDSNGNELQPKDLGLDSVNVEMKIPDNLQEQYKEAYELGTRSIPWWSFNEDTGKWEREGDAELFQIDGIMYGKAKASHFSWWNIDWPIETHAVICGYVTGGENAPVAGAQVVASGVDYQGNSYATTDKDGFYQLKVKKDSQVKLSASYGDVTAKYKDPDSGSEVITVNWEKNTYCGENEISECCSEDKAWRKDISLKILRVEGFVKDSDGNPLEGALVKSSNGAFSYTDSTGKYSLKTGADVTIDLKASYIKNDVTSSAEKTGVRVIDSNLSNIDFTLDITPFKISGNVFYQDSSGTKTSMTGVEVKGGGGQYTRTDSNGGYIIYADKNAASLNIVYTAFMPSGIYAEQSRAVIFNENKEYTIEDVIFIEREAYIKGQVVDKPDGNPLQGIEVESNFGKTVLTDINGNFKIRVPVDSKAYATAYYSNPQLNMDISEDSSIVNIPEDGGTFSVGIIELDIRPSFIKGTVRSSKGTILQGVKVFTEYGGSTLTDSLGEYRLKAPVNKEDVKVFFSYESLNENGLRRRWADPLEKTIDTGNPGQEVTLDAELTLQSYPPIINSLSASPSTTAPGGTITLKVVASDPDNDPLKIKWSKDGTDIGTAATIDYSIPTDASTGLNTFKVIVSDGTNSVSRLIDVFVQENRAPVIYDSWTIPFVGAPGDTMKAIVKAYDLDGDSLSYSWSWKTGSELTGVDVSVENSNEISFNIPSNTKAASYVLNVEVSDGSKGASGEIPFEIKVNRPPEIIVVSALPYEIKSGGTTSLSVSAIDPDGDVLSYAWKQADGTSLGTTKDIKWTSQEVTKETQYEFIVTVSDGNGESVSQSVFVNVLPENSNIPEVKGRVSGYIRDGAGAGIPKAAVRIYSAYDDGASLNLFDDTDDTGYYEFLDVPSGDYYVVVARDGYTSKAKLIRVN